MDYKTFDALRRELAGHVKKLLTVKADEYATEDRLYNFRQMQSLFKTNPARVAMFYQSKHYASLIKITEDIDKGKYPSQELLMEKAGDLIAYTYLVYACLIEETKKKGA